jgi:hypothetical protein
MQAGHQQQGQDGCVAERKAVGHGQDNPVRSAGRGHPLLGGGGGIAPPAQAPDTPAALVHQGVIDQQRHAPEGRGVGKDQDAHLVGQPGGAPRRVLERMAARVGSSQQQGGPPVGNGRAKVRSSRDAAVRSARSS